jgi:hypothetical protein
VHRLCKALCLDLLGEGGSGECAQISCPMRSRVLMLCVSKKIEEDNKEEEDIGGRSPRWG